MDADRINSNLEIKRANTNKIKLEKDYKLNNTREEINKILPEKKHTHTQKKDIMETLPNATMIMEDHIIKEATLLPEVVDAMKSIEIVRIEVFHMIYD